MNSLKKVPKTNDQSSGNNVEMVPVKSSLQVYGERFTKEHTSKELDEYVSGINSKKSASIEISSDVENGRFGGVDEDDVILLPAAVPTAEAKRVEMKATIILILVLTALVALAIILYFVTM